MWVWVGQCRSGPPQPRSPAVVAERARGTNVVRQAVGHEDMPHIVDGAVVGQFIAAEHSKRVGDVRLVLRGTVGPAAPHPSGRGWGAWRGGHESTAERARGKGGVAEEEGAGRAPPSPQHPQGL